VASLHSHVRFEDWTKTRSPVVIGTNAGSQPLAFQNWRRFKEAFVPELIQRAVIETERALGRPVENCLDPFAGSGTTPLACQFLGVSPIAIEVNPYLADLVEAKLTPVDAGLVARRCSEVLSTDANVDPIQYYKEAPPTFVEPGRAGKYLFQHEIAQRLCNLLHAILEIPEAPISRLLRVLLGSAALEVCNATVSGKGRRYRRNWERDRKQPSDLDRAFMQAIEGAVFDVSRYSQRRTTSYELRRGDARQEISRLPPLDLVVFSPPYPNSFDYTDVYNIELWGLGYLQSGTANRTLRHSTLRSHVQIGRDYSGRAPPPSAAPAIAQLRNCDSLWNRNIPDMIGAYFEDLSVILEGVRTSLTSQGRVYMVVGDSKYAGVNVPVARALVEMARQLGFKVIGAEPFRSMRASPQQGGRPELDETLLIFSAP